MTDETPVDTADPWREWRYFLGRWQGKGTGKPGESAVERTYRLVLNEQFIELADRSTYPPQERNPEGEIHEEIGYISHDRQRGRFILREFHVEGYVNQYVLKDREPQALTFVFETEAIENMPPGWSARTTYEIMDQDHFRETFDLAGPQGGWRCFITNELERV